MSAIETAEGHLKSALKILQKDFEQKDAFAQLYDLLEELEQEAAPETDDHDCTCHLETVNSASREPPDWIRNPDCPIHGWRDPDRAYEDWRDRQSEPAEPWED